MHDPTLEQIVYARQTLSTKIYELKVIQSPDECRALASKERSRGAKWPLDPPPVLELIVHDNDPHRTFLHSPFYICNVVLETIHNDEKAKKQEPKGLLGSTSSSLHKVKLSNNREEYGYFVFGDLNIRNPGTHQLKFSLFEMRLTSDGNRVVQLLTTAESPTFKVHTPKVNLAPKESTPLSKQLCEAGIKLRIRKETTNKRRGPVFEWSAGRSQIMGGGVFPSRGLMGGPMHGSRYPNGAPGVDIRDQLSLSTGSSLGIRDHLNNSGMYSTRPGPTAKSLDLWTTSQPGYASHPAYAPAMSSYQPANPAYSEPTTTSSYEIQTGYVPYSDTTYQTPRHAMAPAHYTTSTNIHPQSEQNHMSGHDHSYFPGNDAYSDMHTGGAMSDFGHHDAGRVSDFPTSFTNSTSMVSNGPDQHHSFSGIGEGSNAPQIGAYVDSGDIYRS